MKKSCFYEKNLKLEAAYLYLAGLLPASLLSHLCPPPPQVCCLFLVRATVFGRRDFLRTPTHTQLRHQLIQKSLQPGPQAWVFRQPEERAAAGAVRESQAVSRKLSGAGAILFTPPLQLQRVFVYVCYAVEVSPLPLSLSRLWFYLFVHGLTPI
jgi:hypothetical protein